MDINKYKKYLKPFLNVFLFRKSSTFKNSFEPCALLHKKQLIFLWNWQTELKHKNPQNLTEKGYGINKDTILFKWYT